MSESSAKEVTQSKKLRVWGVEIGHVDVSSGWISCPNSAGGVSVRYNYQNCSEKTIKYLTLSFSAFNAVNDVCQCSIRGHIIQNVKNTGPIAPQAKEEGDYCENCWYNNSITNAKLLSADIVYMDGTEEHLSVSEIEQSAPPAPPKSGGCYVATAVYGSYDCPQVWTLRRYRDNTLASTWYGRAFIHTYYAISPTIVRWFGNTEWFKRMWLNKLDRMVQRLNANGVENTPYQDKNW